MSKVKITCPTAQLAHQLQEFLAMEGFDSFWYRSGRRVVLAVYAPVAAVNAACDAVTFRGLS